MKMPKLYAPGRFVLSFEVYPPKSSQATATMYEALDELAPYHPGFVSCTYGAGGSTQSQTLDIISQIRRRIHVPTTAHLTCVGARVEELRDWVRQAIERGVSNIMALRGDPPKGTSEFKPVAGGFAHANELVAFLRREFPKLGIGVAGYPETHIEAESPTKDLQYLKQKVDAGAHAIFTQLFFDNADYLAFRDRCELMGISIPIVPGILPVLSLAQTERITRLCKARFPSSLANALAQCNGDPAAERQVGIEHATMQCEKLMAADVPGIHFYMLNQATSTKAILDNLGFSRGEERRAAA